MKRVFDLPLFTLAMAGILAAGQTPGAVQSEQFPRFSLKQGQLDADGLPISGAKLCVLGKPDLCYQMPSQAHDKSLTYEFGLEPRSERLSIADGGSWIFFSAVFSGGGSGTLTRFAVLRYSDSGKIVNLLPWVGATNVSEWAMWNVSDASAYPVLVVADFVWGTGETHFDSHYYTVSTWKFDPGADHYIKAFEYKTSRKYNGGDVSPIRVLGPERQEILRRLELK
jgi:hypothetical protein